jgi:hypothetical protein
VKNKLHTSCANSIGSWQLVWRNAVALLLLASLLAVPLALSPAQHVSPVLVDGDDRPKLGTGG